MVKGRATIQVQGVALHSLLQNALPEHLEKGTKLASEIMHQLHSSKVELGTGLAALWLCLETVMELYIHEGAPPVVVDPPTCQLAVVLAQVEKMSPAQLVEFTAEYVELTAKMGISVLDIAGRL